MGMTASHFLALSPVARLADTLLAGFPRSPVLHIARWAARRWPTRRAVTAPVFLLREALARREEVLIGTLASGSRIVLDPKDYGHSHLYFYGTYEEGTTALVERIARPGWTVLDVGANAGYYALLALDAGGPESAVHAFEPNPTVAPLLERTAALAEGRVTVARKACGAGPGRLALYLGADPRNLGLATLSTGAAKGAKHVGVEVTSVDDYCDELGIRPDLIKIDVEGFEDRVVAGMQRLLSRRVPQHVICELSTGAGSPDPSSVIAAFAEHGYGAHHIKNDGALEPVTEFAIENVYFGRNR
jgi:FkbM family methyltransferase